MNVKKVIELPNSRLAREIEKQNKQIQALKLDVVVLRDLLLRTVRILARYENQLPLPPVKK